MVQLVRPRAGHFDLGTGYHGDVWLDLDALFLHPSRLRPHVGLGLGVMFSHAAVQLDDTTSVDAGGAHVAGGLRFRF